MIVIEIVTPTILNFFSIESLNRGCCRFLVLCWCLSCFWATLGSWDDAQRLAYNIDWRLPFILICFVYIQESPAGCGIVGGLVA